MGTARLIDCRLISGFVCSAHGKEKNAFTVLTLIPSGAKLKEVIAVIDVIVRVLSSLVTDLIASDPAMKDRILLDLRMMWDFANTLPSDQKKALDTAIKFFEAIKVARNPK
jgi:hypothetical protein